VAWSWVNGHDRRLIVVNLSKSAAQGKVEVPWDDLRGKMWRLADSLSGDTYDRSGDEIRDQGLFVNLQPWSCHFFRLHML
jgi:hypothetical protein